METQQKVLVGVAKLRYQFGIGPELTAICLNGDKLKPNPCTVI
jgi:hypothetical protein